MKHLDSGRKVLLELPQVKFASAMPVPSVPKAFAIQSFWGKFFLDAFGNGNPFSSERRLRKHIAKVKALGPLS